MIAIIDYGVGNTTSVLNMLRHIGSEAIVTSDPAVIVAATGLILPGVGSFDKAMEMLASGPLIEAILASASLGTPLLGICLGMQLLLDGSDEGQRPGLGLIPGWCRRLETFPEGELLRIPHMGWNEVTPSATNGSRLFSNQTCPWRFYFVHSFFADCERDEDVSATTTYGARFACAVAHRNVMGVQFHPEKSHTYGKQLLLNFAGLTCSL